MGASMSNEYYPDYAVHPGLTLAEVLKEQAISPAELARRTGFSEKHVSEVVNANSSVSPEFALALQRATGVPARLWNNLERDYQEALARGQDRARLAGQEEWLKDIPYRELVKKGWIEQRDNLLDQLIVVLEYFGVASPEQWREKWRSPQVAFRRSPAYEAAPGPLSAWIRRGEILARGLRCKSYDKQAFRRVLVEARPLTRQQPECFCSALQASCAEAGVAVVFVPQLPGTRVSGATQWLASDKALVQLSLRHRSNDHLWFAFYHEAGHILLHGKRDAFLYVDGSCGFDEQEKQADRFAADLLVPPEDYGTFAQAQRFDVESIRAFAESIGIASGIVVGRLQHDGILSWQSQCNRLKVRLMWSAE